MKDFSKFCITLWTSTFGSVAAFSCKKGMNQKDAFNYLNDNDGIGFIVDCYEAEHTLSPDDAVNDCNWKYNKSG